jgi:hypothetical protein
MPSKAFLVVRSVLSDPSLRAQFEHWYATDHLPRAIVDLGAEKAWRLWSETDPNVHCAVYRFVDIDALKRGVGSDGFKALVVDYDRTWPNGVARTREILSLVEDLSGA